MKKLETITTTEYKVTEVVCNGLWQTYTLFNLFIHNQKLIITATRI